MILPLLVVFKDQLNKQTVKDAYPLPDKVQDQLSGSKVLSKLGLHSGYWQMPVKEEDCMKTAFCPGPGMGPYEFCRMPFGVTGGPSSFQRPMTTTCNQLYIDDVLVHSYIICSRCLSDWPVLD